MSGPFDFDPTDDDALAADYALGALDRAAMLSAELRLQRDPEFARAVAGWQALLSPLADEVTPVTPAAIAWARIERAIDPAPVRTREAASPPARSLWASLGLWRGLTGAATTVAAVAVALLASRPAVPPSAQTPSGTLLTAAMAASGKSAVLLNATFDPARGAVILTPASADRSRGKTPELWVIVGSAAPRSLGVIDLHGPAAHRIPDDLRPLMGQGATLAISLEPAGGSPTGAPTGPVIMTGKLAAI